MRLVLTALLLQLSSFAFGQVKFDEIYLQRTLKQDGEQYNFTILDEDKHGVWWYKKDRFYFWYKAQKVLSTQGASSGTLLHGLLECYYENKQLSKKGKFSRGLKTGEWMYWRNDGTLYMTENWKSGKLNGTKTLYNERGEVKETIKIKGSAFKREVNDSTIYSKRNGKLESIFIRDVDGNLVSSEERKNGELHGVAKFYENGKLVEKVHYKKGEELSRKAMNVKREKSDSTKDGDSPKQDKKLLKKKEDKQDSKTSSKTTDTKEKKEKSKTSSTKKEEDKKGTKKKMNN